MKRFLIALSLCVALTTVVHAELLSYEPFDYDAGPVAGLTVTGTGYSAEATYTNDNGQILAAGFTYPGLSTTGKAVEMDDDGGTILYATFDLSETGPFAKAGLLDNGNIGGATVEGSLYISFLVQATNEFTPQSWNGITTFLDGGEKMFLGQPWGNSQFGPAIAGTGYVIGDPGVDIDNATHMIIVKIEYKANDLDDVTFFIDPDLSKTEDQQDPSKMLSMQQSMAFDLWTYRGVKKWKFDELRLATSWNDVIDNRKDAQNPTPAENAVDVPADQVLSWQSGPEASPVSYNVYLGESKDLTVADLQADPDNTDLQLDPELAKDKTYYWRVDSVMVAGSTDPNDLVTGSVWTFQTELSLPVIAPGSPVDQFAFLNETVTFTVDAVNPLDNGLHYKWYQGPSGDTSNPVGEDALTLDVTVTDFGATYWCAVSNSSGTANSQAAGLIEKVKLAHWPCEAINDPNSIVTATPVSSFFMNEGGIVESVEGVVTNSDNPDTKAYKFNNAAIWTDPAQASYFDVMNTHCTVATWVKTPALGKWSPIISRHGEGQGWQLREVWETGSAGFTTRGTGSDDGTASNVSIGDDEWHYIVATLDVTAGEKKVYIDGVLKVTDIVNSSITPTLSPVALAARVYPDGDGWSINDLNNITIDDVQLWNYPMDKYEVADFYVAVQGDMCIKPNVADLTGDCKVDLKDFAIIAANWLECGLYPSCIDTLD